jgi:hypothetical protein
MNTTESMHAARCRKMDRLATDFGKAVLNVLLIEFRRNSDAVRNAIGSVGVRNLEIYESYRNQRDAALEEWLHEGGSNG